ncbi:gliding motility-associated C-terminal domain-containing protein [Pedobacter nyackensis]|uniref:Gliding motility-associated C-terminal domain-containing protein n=1 Tax=Pedobacter nyackensis TaxID=475255 RepID=A0A1W2DSE2_9SPHI|nr:gliding motility-associated C-terminal domain-containing protein [Pedobacter nyackensis]SMD00371.1 gliding motility-associated C-terminal domain-containing protein [Pedobacter nyackensis]
MKLRLFLILVLLYQSSIAFSEVITVTSNADAGVGTLKEALTKAAANGVVEKDYIHFNLPGNTEADRTILLQTELPRVSSNLVIDGSSQPGSGLGISTAKIIIKPNRYIYKPRNWTTAAFYLFQVSNVEIYGFYFTGFYNLLSPYGVYSGTKPSGIFAIASNDITIGAPGKINIFSSNEIGLHIALSDDELYYQPLAKGVKVQSNWVGLTPEGTNNGSNLIESGMVISSDGGIIGGSNIDHGNIFVANGLSNGGKDNVVENNKFGIDAHGNISNVARVGCSGEGLTFRNNIASSFYVEFSYLKNFAVMGNKDLIFSGNVTADFSMYYCENGKFGTDADEDKNTIRIRNGAIGSTGGKNIEIRKNSIHCSYPAYAFNDSRSAIPLIQVLINTDTEYSGTATPNSDVYIYNDNTDCNVCSPVEFYAKLKADPSGNWKITGDFSNNKFVSNATLINSSSEYTQPRVLSARGGYPHLTVNPSCGLNNGSIKLLNLIHVLKVEWFNTRDEKVGEGIEISGLGPGRYYAKAYNGKCFVRYNEVDLINSKPIINDQNLIVSQPGCGTNNGSIKGISAWATDGSMVSVKWLDNNNNVVGTGSTNISGLAPGKYTLNVETARNCGDSYGPIILTNQTGPNIDQSTADIQSSSCNVATGSIKNIQVTGSGTLTYRWKNAAGQQVGNAAELINMSAGQYTLEVKDVSACPALVSSPITIPEINGITINTANKLIDKATCNTGNGRITGITVSGATSYQWLDAGGTVVASTLNLTGMPAGKYRLVASNSVCNKTSEELTIELAQSTRNYTTTKISTPATCGLDNGKIEAIFTNDQPGSCFWKNNAGTIVGNSRILENQGAGAYDLYAIDDLGCERFLQQYSIGNLAGASINRGVERILNDECGLGSGQIIAPGLSGGQLPYFYEWKDAGGRVLASGATLDGIKAGVYQLTIGDALVCSRQTISYTVNDESRILPAPVVNNLKICAAGDALIQVLQPVNGKYLLYTGGGSLVDQNNTGTFKVNVKESQSFSVVLRQGNCESLASSCRITIENDGISKLANALSPNNDGVNDEWLLPGMQNYPEATVAIYNRYGHKVFETTGYRTPFNGRRNGNELPIGTYYYIIDLKRGCGLQKGSLTIVR